MIENGRNKLKHFHKRNSVLVQDLLESDLTDAIAIWMA